jgi:hypothetical protein
MVAGRGNLQRAFGRVLAADVLEVNREIYFFNFLLPIGAWFNQLSLS